MKSKINITCANIFSAVKSVAHDQSLPVPTPSQNIEEIATDSNSDQVNKSQLDELCSSDDSSPQLKTFEFQVHHSYGIERG